MNRASVLLNKEPYEHNHTNCIALAKTSNNQMRLLTTFLIALLTACLLNLNVAFGQDAEIMTEYPEFSRADSLLGFPFPERTCYDVHFYKLDIVPDIESKSLNGTVEIHFTATKNFKTLQIDLYPELKIKQITCNGAQLKYDREFTAVFVHFTKKVKKGTNSFITIEYFGKPIEAINPPWEGGMVWRTDTLGNPWIGISVEQEGGSVWWPCKDLISDKADSALISIATPQDLTGVSNGRLIREESMGEQKKYTWRVSYPIVNYNITFYIGQFAHFSIDYGTKYKSELDKLDFYVLHEYYSDAYFHFQQVPKILQTLENLFGPYPFPRDGYKLINSPYEGMEHQTAIAYGSGFENFYNGFDYIILHESAHEWWGNAVTATDFSDIWLQEGFATYAEYMFYNAISYKTCGYDYMAYTMDEINNVKPVIGPSGVRFWDINDTDVYNKGAAFLNTIANQFDSYEEFTNTMKKFFAKHCYGHTTTQDFIEHFKPFVDYIEPMANLYLKDTVFPKLKIKFDLDDPRTIPLDVHFSNTPDEFKMKIGILYYKGFETFGPIGNTKMSYELYHPLNAVYLFINPFLSNIKTEYY